MRLFFLFLAFGACSTSGIEPQWNATQQPEGPDTYQNLPHNPSRQYRVEIGKRGNDFDTRQDSQIRVSGRGLGARTQSRSQQSTQRQSSFVVGQAGHPMRLNFRGDSYHIVLGQLQAPSIEVGIAQISVPSLNPVEVSKVSGLQTRTRVVLGQWSPLGSMAEDIDSGQRNRFWGNTSGQGQSGQRGNNFFELEIKVTPLGP